MKKVLSVLICAALLMAGGCSAEEQTPKETLVTTEDSGKIEVPDFSELTWEQIEMKYRKYNITPQYEYNDAVPEGGVISQSPKEGTKIKDGDGITVTVSLGAKLVEIDDYTGRNITDVQTLIEKQGLKCVVTREENDDITENCVIRTSPSAREKVEKGTTITCYVSMGAAEEELKMPDLVGMSIEDATSTALENGGLTLIISYNSDSDAAPGTVIEQNIEKDTVIEPNSKVEVVLSGEKASETNKTTISVKMKSGLSGEFMLKYYVDGTLVEDKTEIKELSLTKKIDWEVSGTDVHVYSVVVTCMSNNESGVLYEMEVDFNQNPPAKDHHDTFNAGIFTELMKR